MNTEFSIRPVCSQDVEGIYAIRIMDGVFENTMGLPSNRLEQQAAFFEGLGPNDHQFVAVDDKNLVLGLVGLHVSPNPRSHHVGSIGIFVHRDYQGKGIGTALLRTVVNLADNWLMLERVELEVFSDNRRAISLYEQFGFEAEGLKRKATVRNGVYMDDLLMARLRPEQAAKD